MEFKDLTEEQKAKLRECKSKEEFVFLAEEEGVELTDDVLEAIAGGEEIYCSEISDPDYRDTEYWDNWDMPDDY